MSIFALFVGVGSSLSLLRIVLSVDRWQASRWVNVGLMILAGTLAGSRLGYISAHFNHFQNHLWEIPQFWLGGLTWSGAVLGAFVSIFLIYWRWKLPLNNLLDTTSVMVAPLAITTWIGCYFAGVAYGSQTPAGAWWGIPGTDEYGVFSQRIPLQPLAAILLTLYYFFLDQKYPRLRKPGQKAFYTYLGLSLNLLLFSLFRADPSPLWMGQRLDFWFACLFFVSSLFLGRNSLLKSHARISTLA